MSGCSSCIVQSERARKTIQQPHWFYTSRISFSHMARPLSQSTSPQWYVPITTSVDNTKSNNETSPQLLIRDGSLWLHHVELSQQRSYKENTVSLFLSINICIINRHNPITPSLLNELHLTTVHRHLMSHFREVWKLFSFHLIPFHFILFYLIFFLNIT